MLANVMLALAAELTSDAAVLFRRTRGLRCFILKLKIHVIESHVRKSVWVGTTDIYIDASLGGLARCCDASTSPPYWIYLIYLFINFPQHF